MKKKNKLQSQLQGLSSQKEGGKSAISLLINLREKRVLGSPACVGQAGWLLEGEDNLVSGGAALRLAGSECVELMG